MLTFSEGCINSDLSARVSIGDKQISNGVDVYLWDEYNRQYMNINLQFTHKAARNIT